MSTRSHRIQHAHGIMTGVFSAKHTMKTSLFRHALLFLTLFCAVPLLAATPTESPLVWRGDIATSRSLMQPLSAAWQKAGHPAIKLEPFSTISGIDATLEGKADLAGSARPAFPKREQEAGLIFVPVAWDALVLIVHRNNPVRNVSLGQLHDIYYGKIKNWKALGGPDEPINLYSVASPLDGIEFSLRRYLFRRGNQPIAAPRLYINTSQLEAAVAIDPQGLAVSTLSGIRDNKQLAGLSVEGVSPSLEHVADGSYPLYHPLYLAAAIDGPRQDEVHAFLDFAASDAGRALITANHLLPWDGTAPLATELDQHLAQVQDISAPRMDGPVAAAGASFAARSAQAPTSELTLEARQRLADKRARDEAARKAKAENTAAAEPSGSD